MAGHDMFWAGLAVALAIEAIGANPFLAWPIAATLLAVVAFLPERPTS